LVSLRQTGIIYPNLLKSIDPIIFHVPLNGVLEWTTIEDSARLLERVCQDNVPEEFWRRFYNIGSGHQYRTTNFEFEQFLMKVINVNPMQKIFDSNWFALQNFHGQWYLDSDILENCLHFRHNIPIEQYFDLLQQQIPIYYQLAEFVPRFLVKTFVMKRLTKVPIYGTMNWIENNN
jgi:nucleoside-diphosphate-sugar epimerase